jgi:hypothetical protein
MSAAYTLYDYLPSGNGYAYTHVAPEAGLELGAYPAIRAWLSRVAAQPRHAPITAP